MLIEIRQTDGPVSFDGNEFVEVDYENAHYLGAFLGQEPVGQICHVFDTVYWWTDALCVRPDMRDKGLALKLIECNYHLALQNGITMVMARSKKNHGATPQTFVRNDSRLQLGETHKFLSDALGTLFVRRDLGPLLDRIKCGAVQPITFPHRAVLSAALQESA